MLNSLFVIAALLFLAHVILLFTAFTRGRLAQRRYFYSHLTLWLTGAVIFILTLLYSGTGQSAFLDYFGSPLSRVMILVFTFSLSLVAHIIVNMAVLPLLSKGK